MNKTQLVDALASRIGDRRTAATAVDGVLEIIVDTVGSGGSVSLTGFGVFEARARAARVARNPRTGETVQVPATVVPAFRPGTGFKSSVGGDGSAAGTARPVPARRSRSAAAAPAVPSEAPSEAALAPAAEPAPEPKSAKGTRAAKGSAKASGAFTAEKKPAKAKAATEKTSAKTEKAAPAAKAEKAKPAKKPAKGKK